jgi:hypothetical protein
MDGDIADGPKDSSPNAISYLGSWLSRDLHIQDVSHIASIAHLLLNVIQQKRLPPIHVDLSHFKEVIRSAETFFIINIITVLT